MSQTSKVNKQKLVGSVATEYPWSQPIANEDDLTVILVDHSDGTEAVQTISTHYSVVIEDDKSAATITFVTAPTSSYTVVMHLDTIGTDSKLQT